MKICYLILLLGLSVQMHSQSFERLEIPAMESQKHHSNSSSWGDIDNDGDLDLFVTNGETNEPNEFYINDGKLGFTLKSGMMTDKNVPSFSSAWGDFNNDGWIDLYVANCNYQGESGEQNFLFKNNGDSSFEQIREGVMVNQSHPSYACSWVDYDNDGWLDMYVVNAYGYRNRLYKNLGDGSFIEIEDDPIVKNGTHDISCSWSDYDNDGDSDLIVVSGHWYTTNRMYRNNGDGTFTGIINEITSKKLTNGRGASWGDYNNDGWMDLILYDRDSGINILFKNNGDKSFTEITTPDFEPHSRNSGSWGDFNNDGFIDLLLSGGLFLENNTAGGFEKVENEWIKPGQGIAWSTNSIDVNMDGNLDVFQSNRWKNENNNLGPDNYIFLNQGDQCNGYAHVELRGLSTNFFGLGSSVYLYSKNALGETIHQKREMSCLSSAGYTTQSGNTLHFGLNESQEIDSIVVHWPSQIKTTYLGLPINDHFILFEDGTFQQPNNKGSFSIVPIRDPVCKDKIRALTVNSASHSVIWQKNGLEISDSDTLILKSSEMGNSLFTVKDGLCGEVDSFYLPSEVTDIKMFPNPANQFVNFSLSDYSQEVEYALTVYDMSGRLIKNDVLEFNAQIEDMSVNDLAAGTYLIVVESGCSKFLKKLVVAF